MSRAETLTKLPLDRWAQIIGMNPMHFNGIYWPDHPPTVCQQPWMQRADQAVDRVGREEVAYAIAQAEYDIEKYLGYRLLPSWEVDEWKGGIRPNKPELFNSSVVDVRGFNFVAFADWGYTLSGGVRGKTVIEAGRPIAYSDPDGDTFKELATVTATMPALGMSACEVKLYMQATDVPTNTPADDRYEIKPIQVTISGLTATILFQRVQCVLPARYDDIVPPVSDSHLRGVNGSDDANFLANVDVYRVYNDPQTQVTFLWEPFANVCGCDGGCVTCAYTAQTGCLMSRMEPRLGVLSYQPASWNIDTGEFDSEPYSLWRQPDITRLYYYAGWRDKTLACPTVQMAPEWERAVAYYAASLLDRPICECNNVRTWVAHWQELPSEREQIVDNPFGVSRGATFAWKRVMMHGNAIGRPVLAT